MGFLSGSKDKKSKLSNQPQPTPLKAKPTTEENSKLTDENAKNLARMLQIYMRDNNSK